MYNRRSPMNLSSIPMAFNVGIISPANTPTFNFLILRTPSLILHSPSQSPPFSPSILHTSRILPLRAASPQIHTYSYPDPIPEFAISETEKFKAELRRKLIQHEDTFGEELDSVVDTCSKICAEFLHKEYGGPGTLTVEPFTYMFVALKEKNLPGAPFATRESLLWAQNNVDHDWKVWSA